MNASRSKTSLRPRARTLLLHCLRPRRLREANGACGRVSHAAAEGADTPHPSLLRRPRPAAPRPAPLRRKSDAAAERLQKLVQKLQVANATLEQEVKIKEGLHAHASEMLTAATAKAVRRGRSPANRALLRSRHPA